MRSPVYHIDIWFCECPVTTAVDLYYLQTKIQRSLLQIRQCLIYEALDRGNVNKNIIDICRELCLICLSSLA